MADTQLKTRIILRNDTKGNWDLVKTTAILLKGEIGIEFDPSAGASTGYKTRMKVGDGINTWDNLPYFGGTEAKVYQVEVAAGADHKAAIATAVGSNEKNSGDIAIVKELINAASGSGSTAIPEHRQYTAYVYDSTLETPDWVAMDGNYNAENVIFAQDVMSYTNAVGLIPGGSQTNPKKIIDAGKSVKDLFTAIFGEQQDSQPTITDNSKVTITQTNHSLGGNELGSTTVANGTYQIVLTNKASTNFGYRIGTTQHNNTQEFYYPVVKQSDGDVKITLPTGKTSSDITMVTGTLVSSSGNILYCNFGSNKTLKFTVKFNAGVTTDTQQTNFGAVGYEIHFGAARRTENDASTEITKFLTYLKNDATDQSKLTRGNLSANSSAWIISSGTYNSYYYGELGTLQDVSWFDDPANALGTIRTTSSGHRFKGQPSSVIMHGTYKTYYFVCIDGKKVTQLFNNTTFDDWTSQLSSIQTITVGCADSTSTSKGNFAKTYNIQLVKLPDGAAKDYSLTVTIGNE